jgi:hypothetical protein
MRATVRKEFCPACQADTQQWVVRGSDGDCWMCTRDWTRALRYAIGRSQQRQPGTGDQVQNREESNEPK